VEWAVAGYVLLTTLLVFYTSGALHEKKHALLRTTDASKRELFFIARLKGTFTIYPRSRQTPNAEESIKTAA